MSPELSNTQIRVSSDTSSVWNFWVHSRTSFPGETSGGVVKSWPFSQTKDIWEQGSGEAELETRPCQMFR